MDPNPLSEQKRSSKNKRDTGKSKKRLTPAQLEQVKNVETIQQWSFDESLDFCSMHAFSPDKIQEELSKIIEFSRPAHEASSQDWQEVQKPSKKKATITPRAGSTNTKSDGAFSPSARGGRGRRGGRGGGGEVGGLSRGGRGGRGGTRGGRGGRVTNNKSDTDGAPGDSPGVDDSEVQNSEDFQANNDSVVEEQPKAEAPAPPAPRVDGWANKVGAASRAQNNLAAPSPALQNLRPPRGNNNTRTTQQVAAPAPPAPAPKSAFPPGKSFAEVLAQAKAKKAAPEQPPPLEEEVKQGTMAEEFPEFVGAESAAVPTQPQTEVSSLSALDIINRGKLKYQQAHQDEIVQQNNTSDALSNSPPVSLSDAAEIINKGKRALQSKNSDSAEALPPPFDVELDDSLKAQSAPIARPAKNNVVWRQKVNVDAVDARPAPVAEVVPQEQPLQQQQQQTVQSPQGYSSILMMQPRAVILGDSLKSSNLSSAKAFSFGFSQQAPVEAKSASVTSSVNDPSSSLPPSNSSVNNNSSSSSSSSSSSQPQSSSSGASTSSSAASSSSSSNAAAAAAGSSSLNQPVSSGGSGTNDLDAGNDQDEQEALSPSDVSAGGSSRGGVQSYPDIMRGSGYPHNQFGLANAAATVGGATGYSQGHLAQNYQVLPPYPQGYFDYNQTPGFAQNPYQPQQMVGGRKDSRGTAGSNNFMNNNNNNSSNSNSSNRSNGYNRNSSGVPGGRRAEQAATLQNTPSSQTTATDASSKPQVSTQPQQGVGLSTYQSKQSYKQHRGAQQMNAQQQESFMQHPGYYPGNQQIQFQQSSKQQTNFKAGQQEADDASSNTSSYKSNFSSKNSGQHSNGPQSTAAYQQSPYASQYPGTLSFSPSGMAYSYPYIPPYYPNPQSQYAPPGYPRPFYQAPGAPYNYPTAPGYSSGLATTSGYEEYLAQMEYSSSLNSDNAAFSGTGKSSAGQSLSAQSTQDKLESSKLAAAGGSNSPPSPENTGASSGGSQGHSNVPPHFAQQHPRAGDVPMVGQHVPSFGFNQPYPYDTQHRGYPGWNM